MKLLLASALTTGLATALVQRAPSAPPGYCCFTLTATNPELGSAIVEEDTIGQNRIFSNYPDGAYCINPADEGRLYDSLGHTCIISKITQRFQCTQGIRSQNVFVVGGNGDFFVDGDNDFWACPSEGPGDDGGFEIFAHSKTDTTDCVAITMASTNDACAPPLNSPLPSLSVSSTTAPADTAGTAAPSGTVPAGSPIGRYRKGAALGKTKASTQCPQDLSGDFVSPSLIVPVSRKDAGKSYGSTGMPIISPSNSTLFSFNIPSSWTGDCSLLFTLPYADETANPDAYSFSGVAAQEATSGGLKFDLLRGSIDSDVTWWTKPVVKRAYGKTEIVPGNSYTIATFKCPALQSLTYSVRSAGGVELTFAQSAESAETKPVGLFVIKC